MARFIITGEYKDKATKAARKDLKGLTTQTDFWAKQAKKAYAAVTVAAGYYAKKILRDSINNALDDERSQRLLALTLRNVASASDAAVISAEAQISKMQMMYGITDDKLRPALARLARSTGSTSAALYDLELALDISAATGKSLEAVTAALGKAEDGNVASLQRLGLGLDANLIKSKDTKKIFEALRKTFSGFAKQEAKTTEAMFRRINVAADEAKETIGVSLVNAISTLVANSGGVEGIAATFEKLAQDTADTIDGLAKLAAQAKLTGKGTKTSWVQLIPVVGAYLDQIRKTQAETRKLATIAQITSKQVISARNAEYIALKKLKDDNKEKTDKTLEQIMAEEAARKAGFKLTEDIDSIQTVAAAKRLEESRQYKASVIDAAQAQFDAIKRNYDLQNSVFNAQLTAFEVMYAAMKAKAAQGVVIPISMSASMFSGDGMPKIITGLDTAPARGASGMTLAKEAAIAARLAREAQGTFNPSDALDYSMNAQLNNSSAAARVQQVFNVNVNAGAVGNETYLAQVINDSLAQAARLGLTTTPAGYIGSP